LAQRIRNINNNNNNNNQIDREEEGAHQIQIEMDRIHSDDLEARLEMVYVKLKTANARRRNEHKTRADK